MTNAPGDFVEQHERAGALLNGTHISSVGTAAELSRADAEKRRAALYVASQAPDPEDRAELLRMLGLMPPGFEWVGQHNRRKVAT